MRYRCANKLQLNPEDHFPPNLHPGAMTFFRLANELVSDYMHEDWAEFDLVVEHIRSLSLCYDNTWVR